MVTNQKMLPDDDENLADRWQWWRRWRWVWRWGFLQKCASFLPQCMLVNSMSNWLGEPLLISSSSPSSSSSSSSWTIHQHQHSYHQQWFPKFYFWNLKSDFLNLISEAWFLKFDFLFCLNSRGILCNPWKS